jgi:hypothetical protein
VTIRNWLGPTGQPACQDEGRSAAVTRRELHRYRNTAAGEGEGDGARVTTGVGDGVGDGVGVTDGTRAGGVVGVAT